LHAQSRVEKFPVLQIGVIGPSRYSASRAVRGGFHASLGPGLLQAADRTEIFQMTSSELKLETQLPWFRFYVGDVLRRTEDMNATQVGAYLLLLMYHWNHSCLPDENDLPRVARVDGKAWRTMKDKVLTRVRQDVAILDEQKSKAVAKSKKAQNSANARWNANAPANGYANA
jgi:hypothetical protein